MFEEFSNALYGGILIGIAASLMLLFNGRVAGISGIVNGALQPKKSADTLWRWGFLFGLFAGGFLLADIMPQVFRGRLSTPDWTLILAGMLVGFGTLLGSGCTSGHGVCGVSRLSIRSLVATVTFIVAGVLSIVFFRAIGVLA